MKQQLKRNTGSMSGGPSLKSPVEINFQTNSACVSGRRRAQVIQLEAGFPQAGSSCFPGTVSTLCFGESCLNCFACVGAVARGQGRAVGCVLTASSISSCTSPSKSTAPRVSSWTAAEGNQANLHKCVMCVQHKRMHLAEQISKLPTRIQAMCLSHLDRLTGSSFRMSQTYIHGSVSMTLSSPRCTHSGLGIL